MNKVASLPSDLRRDLFRESAARRGLNPALIEKDFWVCWALKHLFTDVKLKERLVFKGGTALSKVFGLINRFSEDIDLVLDWRLLGYDSKASKTPTSKTQQDLFNKELNAKAASFIAKDLLKQLRNQMAIPGVTLAVDPDDPQTVNILYPAVFNENYLRPTVRLEIGPLASWVPSARHTIRPYASEDFPDAFEDASCPVTAISAERTFWEKATILHQQAHRVGPMPLRYSRHYYDLAQMSGSSIGKRAVANLALLKDVVEFKQRFYPSAWARYDLAKPGTFCLLPSEAHAAELEKDYREMGVMIFNEAPDFDSILSNLKTLEATINNAR
jgi:hypothetical protein